MIYPASGPLRHLGSQAQTLPTLEFVPCHLHNRSIAQPQGMEVRGAAIRHSRGEARQRPWPTPGADGYPSSSARASHMPQHHQWRHTTAEAQSCCIDSLWKWTIEGGPIAPAEALWTAAPPALHPACQECTREQSPSARAPLHIPNLVCAESFQA